MRLKKIDVKNFRLLYDVSLLLESETTVIVGRNNCGKTSLTEVMKQFLDATTVAFRFEDFSFGAHTAFFDAFIAHTAKAEPAQVRQLIPSIRARLVFEYKTTDQLGPLCDFVIDTDPECLEAIVEIEYRLDDGKQDELFKGLSDTSEDGKKEFFQTMRDRIHSLFSVQTTAVDPHNEENRLSLDLGDLRIACLGGFIFAQRGLDDVSQKDRVVIGRVLENLFATAKLSSEDSTDHETVRQLEVAVKEIQERLGADFNKKLDALLPALAEFGYPGLSDAQLLTETTFDVSRLLSNNTKMRYHGLNWVHLPESYNGLGARNIILILLQLREFFKVFQSLEVKPAVHLVFIEEPEVHLHPQMQEVFIRKLGHIAEIFSQELEAPWPVQFIVTTHSSHIANEARFDAIRYFLAKSAGDKISATVIKDLRKGLAGKAEPARSFLHQYLTLTRCDLFFADKAVLIEGTSERLLLPKMIAEIDEGLPEGGKLSSQYVSVIEVGGAYAHIFFDLVEFLELQTLVITDIDTVSLVASRYVASAVAQSSTTSNACLKSWFGAGVHPGALLGAGEAQKIRGSLRIAYQVPEAQGGPCGRSFEDAFMLANSNLFPPVGGNSDEHAQNAWEEAKAVKKSEFALDHLLKESSWLTPRYIRDGLVWLARSLETERVGASR